jgi:hypothetical protein
MIVGIIGLAIAILTIAGYSPWNAGAGQAVQARAVAPQTAAAAPTQAVAPAAPIVSPQASVVVVGAPTTGSVPQAAPPGTPSAAPAEVAP